LSFAVTTFGVLDAFSVGALPLRFLAAALLIIVELEALEAAVLVTFIRVVSALSLTVTKVSGRDAVTVSTGPFTLWIATTNLTVVEAVSTEAAGFVTFIRCIRALSLSIASVSLVDAVAVLALPLVILTSTLLVVVEGVLLEAALFVTFIRTVRALGLSITEVTLWDTLTVSTSPLGVWVAAALDVVVEWELLEAAALITLIRSISALGFTVTVTLKVDAVTIGTSELGFLAATLLIVVERVFLEAAVVITFIRSVSTLGCTITSAGSIDAITVLALPLRSLATTFLVIVELDALEAAKIVDLLIRFI